MRNFLFATVNVSVLLSIGLVGAGLVGAGVASAQGLPPSIAAPEYGSSWITSRMSLRTPDGSQPSTGQAIASQASDPKAARNVYAAAPAVHGS